MNEQALRLPGGAIHPDECTHLGSGVGTAAGVQLARPGRQVICLVGDGTFVFGPTALWNMDLPHSLSARDTLLKASKSKLKTLAYAAGHALGRIDKYRRKERAK